MADKPSFYSILTADVRYDERLSFFARVLYSDITAMCNVKGYCSAGNEHFADKFEQTHSFGHNRAPGGARISPCRGHPRCRKNRC